VEKTGTEQKQLFRVRGSARREREVDAKWAWTEPAVWTERMVDALERGLEGGRWFSLIDKVYAPRALEAAWGRVKRNGGSGGVDGQKIGDFQRNAGRQLANLSEQLRNGQYEPMKIRRVYIPKIGSHELRPLGVPTIRDRVVQTALKNALEPIFEKEFSTNSYGGRPGRSTKDALRHVQRLLDEGRTWVVDVDIARYFDTIPHEQMLAGVAERVADGRVLDLVARFLKQEVLGATPSYATDEPVGTPQGAVISPLLANIYLNPIDQIMQAEGYAMVRYVDDSVVVCTSRQEAERAMERLRELLGERGLTLHPEKTKIVDTTLPGGFDFLGYHFELGRHVPRTKSLRRFKETIRQITRRSNGHSLRQIIADANAVLRGWFEYFQHSAHRVFHNLDAWVRRRLRSILRGRCGLRGISRGRDHQRWTNAFFRQQGLFTMAEAHAALIRSLQETRRPESRMREICTYGSEGGGVQLPLPL
jgi:RNA-directed DNA polymerase